ncbi:peroxisomal membrane protein PEX14-like isoform X2 [Stegodyphus dumicola]|uniref:peroxisomal membrane protein PEX14-like isoform X2 n=1 Tax=Stegodyphus dumicola TaxID=202533 RepID=UPI0015B00AAF|nr:peroxisomal membrane protein PEX14-like isoform X2 [Stegodyphus dumicola]
MTDKQETANKTTDEQHKRQSLVDAAVIFLLNPEVYSKPNEKKVAFLKSKGMSDSEIALAFEKADRYPPDHPAQTVKRLASYRPLPPPLPPVQTYSFWSQFNRISTSILILGVALFGFHRFYQLYIEPWLFGKETEADRLIRMEKQLTEVNSSIAQLRETISVLEGTINNQKGKIDKFVQSEVNEYLPTPLVLQDLKGEISTIKSILLSRHQFPAVPKFTTSIPAWQLPNSEKNAEEDPESETKAKEEGESQESAAEDMDDVSIINGSLSSEHYTDVLDSPESVKTT